ncbi:MAG: 8-oxo-dGTP diphosphatase [Halocynthiibacter sp.]|jgi:8-oxo-dGTP diphosphatase
MNKRYGKFPERGRAYTYRPGAYGILLRGAEILLTYQRSPEPEFQLPGGGIDPGESPIAALHREVMEETGWRIGAPRLAGCFRRFIYMPDYDIWAEKLCYIFVARPVACLGAASEPDHSAIWMPAKLSLDVIAGEGNRAALRSILRR